MDNRRASRRRPGPKPGRIEHRAGPSRPCIISNYSHTGARLEIADADKIPDRFVLVFEEGIARMQCDVKWREVGALGVEFL